MSKTRARYDDEFKTNAVTLCKYSQMSIKSIARYLCVNEGSLYNLCFYHDPCTKCGGDSIGIV